eukprot:2232578-Pleurochrysis_carterae.AAC.3
MLIDIEKLINVGRVFSADTMKLLIKKIEMPALHSSVRKRQLNGYIAHARDDEKRCKSSIYKTSRELKLAARVAGLLSRREGERRAGGVGKANTSGHHLIGQPTRAVRSDCSPLQHRLEQLCKLAVLARSTATLLGCCRVLPRMH